MIAQLKEKIARIFIRERDHTPDNESTPKSRKGTQWILAGGLFFVLLVLSIASVSLSQRSNTASDLQQIDAPGDMKTHSITAPGAGVSDADVWITKSEAEMQGLHREMKKVMQNIQRLRAKQKESRNQQPDHAFGNSTLPSLGGISGGTLPGMPPKPVNAPAIIPQMGPGAHASTSITPIVPPSLQSPLATPLPDQTGFAGAQQAQVVPPAPDNGILIVRLTPPPASKKNKPEDKSAWLAISFTPAQLLNGLDGATGGQAQQNPQPVLMQITDMTQMPNRYQQDFKECLITGAGYGDLSSERVYLRLEKLSCIDDDGQAVEETIDGYVTGEDGKVGMRGRLVSKQGQVLAKALLAGIASGIGDAFTQSVSTQSISPLGATSTVPPGAAARAGIYSGVGKALNKLADFYIQQARKLYPVIEVDAGRSVDVIINKGVRLTQWSKH